MGTLQYEDREKEIKCKICYLYENPVSNINDLISPCKCKGTMKYVHKGCLKMWRFRGKSFEDTKKCCQCGVNYIIKGETVPSLVFTLSLTILMLAVIYVVGKLCIHAFLETTLGILKDFFFNDLRILFEYGHTKRHNYFTTRDFDKDIIDMITINMHYVYVFVLVIVYMLASYQNFFSMFNYIFTFWRLMQFEFIVDRILFVSMSIYYLKYISKSMFIRIENFLTYFFNYR
ncbi:E3 ubiquitin-protein ligase MARCH5 [Nosema granulosis]|uniref:E3 ubiquitin-protein ligase MARCH5 n=1 Tax=Nosema granulosis TaxID=83296 RepID=A0A9P6L0H6_9MICR|nr:E3 ubiquitin-protein ligase MARCH5 [Nosema granulosis]